MKLKPDQLDGHLRQGLKPIYLVASDQPLLLQEAAHRIREVAAEAGYASREVVAVDARSDWEAIFANAGAPSLFAERRVLDLKLVTGKPGQAGGRALSAYADAPAEDLLVIVSVGSLESSVRSAKWYKTLEKAGVAVELWPPGPDAMGAWVLQRMRAAGLDPEPEAADVLAQLSEGNLLAAQQEIDKLVLLHPGASLSLSEVEAAVADNARFDVFRIVDETLAGNPKKVIRVLHSLRAEGAPTALVLSVLAQNLMSVAKIAWECESDGSAPDRVLSRQRMWPARRRLFQRALARRNASGWRKLLQRCARTDRVIKGLAPGDAWLELERLLLAAASGGAR